MKIDQPQTAEELQKTKILFQQIAAAVKNPAAFNWSTEQIQQAIEKHQFLIYEKANLGGTGSEVLAFICYQALADELEILALGTKEGFQSQGIMRKLLNSFAENNSKSFSAIFLEVHESNQPAIHLYDSLGFKLLHTRNKYYSDQAAALVFKKELYYSEA